MIGKKRGNKSKWFIGFFIFFIFSSALLFFLQSRQPRESQEDLRWKKIETLITNEKNWETPSSIVQYDKRLKKLCETTSEPRELMNRLAEISINEKYPGRLDALVTFAKCSHIKRNPQLKNEFKEELLGVIKSNKHKYEIITPLDMVGGFSHWYKTTSPPEKEEKIFLDLLTDPDCHPLVRSTTAYYLRNVREPNLRNRVRVIAEDLLAKYKDLEKEDSRITGRLELALRVLNPTSTLLDTDLK